MQWRGEGRKGRPLKPLHQSAWRKESKIDAYGGRSFSTPNLLDTIGDASESGNQSRKPDLLYSLNHIPGDSNVLYLNGHVQYHKYPTKFPVRPVTALSGIGGKANGFSTG